VLQLPHLNPRHRRPLRRNFESARRNIRDGYVEAALREPNRVASHAAGNVQRLSCLRQPRGKRNEHRGGHLQAMIGVSKLARCNFGVLGVPFFPVESRHGARHP
jgi:hypothetical protein